MKNKLLMYLPIGIVLLAVIGFLIYSGVSNHKNKVVEPTVSEENVASENEVVEVSVEDIILGQLKSQNLNVDEEILKQMASQLLPYADENIVINYVEVANSDKNANATDYTIVFNTESALTLEYTAMTGILKTVAYVASGYGIEEVDTSYSDPCDISEVTKKNAHKLDNVASVVDALYEENTNILFSETDFDLALGMLGNGADGDTLKSLENYYSFDTELKKSRDNELMRAYDNYKNVNMNIANGIYGMPNYYNKYTDNIKNYYHADIQNVDFGKDGVKAVNDFVKSKNKTIKKDMYEDADFDKNGLSIVSTMTFNGEWFDSVHEDDEMDIEFSNADKSTTATTGIFSTAELYYENENATAFGKYYKGRDILFIGIVPNKDICDKNGDFKISDIGLNSLLSDKTVEYSVKALIPSVNFNTKSNVNSATSSLGLDYLYDSENMPNFNNLSNEQTYVSSIIQNNTVALNTYKIDKEGKSDDKDADKTVLLNKPFAFMIYDEQNDEVLLFGKITNLKLAYEEEDENTSSDDKDKKDNKDDKDNKDTKNDKDKNKDSKDNKDNKDNKKDNNDTAAKPTPKPTPKHSHSYTASVTSQPNCTNGGVKTYKCSCGDSYTESLPANGHSWVDESYTETIHHEGSGHYEERTVDTSSTSYVCNDCGYASSSQGAMSTHLASSGHSSASESKSGSVTTESVWVQDSDAWDETVTHNRRRCTSCGATEG